MPSPRLTLALALLALPGLAVAGPDRRPSRVAGTVFDLPGAADYVQRYASHPPSPQRLQRARQVPITRPHPRSPLFASSVVGDIVVVEGGGGYTYTDPCPEPNQSQTCTYFNDNAIFDIANEVLRHSRDEHDVIVMFTTFAQTGAGYAAYFLPIQNDIEGLGDCNRQTGESHGCVYDDTGGLRVQGLQYMSSVDSWEEQEASYFGRASSIGSLDHWVYGGLGHEALHRWGSALRFVHPGNGQLSKAMLGESLSHWNPSVDGKGSMHYGWDWDDRGDGNFELLGESFTYWDLDLYNMGVLPAEEVQPWYIIENARSDELATLFRAMGYNMSATLTGVGLFIPLPPVAYLEEVIRQYYPHMGEHISATGQRLDLTIQNVLDAEGPRVPGYGAAPDRFREVWALVTRPGQTVSQVGAYIAELEAVRKHFEQWFAQRTGGRGRMCTNLTSPCAEPRLSLRGARVDDSLSSGDGVVDADESVDLYAELANLGDDSGHNLRVTLTPLDPALAVDRSEVALGDLAPDESREAAESLLVYVDKQAACGRALPYRLRYAGDDVGPQDLLGYLYVGLKRVAGSDFESGDEGWTFNPGGEDDASAGGFARGQSTLSRIGAARLTPAGQAHGSAALFTDPAIDSDPAAHDVDGGFTSVLSPAYSLDGLKDPHLAYRYWHVAVSPSGEPRGEDDNRLLVELSADDGKSFKEVVRHVDSNPEWAGALLRIADHFDPLPTSVRMRITQFDDGADDLVEAAIDDVMVMDLAGACEPEGCGCRSQAGQPGALLLFALGLGLRRRRHA